MEVGPFDSSNSTDSVTSEPEAPQGTISNILAGRVKAFASVDVAWSREVAPDSMEMSVSLVKPTNPLVLSNTSFLCKTNTSSFVGGQSLRWLLGGSESQKYQQ